MAYRHYFILALLVIANLAIAGYIINDRYTPKATAGHAAHTSNKLPSLELESDTGQKISTKRFAGYPLFVQFVNPYADEQVESVTRVYEGRPKRPVSWLLITKDARRLRERLSSSGMGEALIVESGYEELRKTLNVPDCCEKWIVFDSSGELKDSGYYNQDDTAAKLRQFVDGQETVSPELIAQAISSAESRQLSQLRARSVRSRSGKAVIVMFSSVCTSCPTGQLISLLNTHAKLNQGIEHLALLPNTFTPADLNNFRINMDISFPVKMADEELSRQWSSLIQRYGENAVNGAVLVLDKGKLSAVHGLGETKRHLMALASQQ